jgi:hypothetical protein
LQPFLKFVFELSSKVVENEKKLPKLKIASLEKFEQPGSNTHTKEPTQTFLNFKTKTRSSFKEKKKKKKRKNRTTLCVG